MAEMPKLAVFGCGYWGKNHIRTLHELGALACVVDEDAGKAGQLAQAHGSQARTADEVLADPAIDGIVMALPAQFHAQYAVKAFAAGKHVFAEKPIALSTEDAKAMVDAAQQAGRVLMAGHILRYHNAFRAMMALVDDGTLGEVKYVQSHRLAFGKFHARFDAAWDLAPHDLSLLLSVAKRTPTKVSNRSVALASDQTDFAHIDLDFGEGLKGHVYVSRHSPYMERRFTIFGEKAMAVWDDMEADWARKVSVHEYQAMRGETDWQFEKQEPRFIPCEQGMALTDELQHFIHCIQTGDTPFTDGAQGLAVVDILNTISAA